MLQRRQSLYLFLVFILSVLLFTGPLASVSTGNTVYFLKHAGVTNLAGERMEVSTWPLTVMISVSTLLSFLTIFSYLKRPRQMRMTLFLMFFNLGLVAMVAYYVAYLMHNFNGEQFLFEWRIVIPPVMLVLLIMAFRGIRRDELLVRAADRIR
jgi:hypothetical protein